MWFTNLEKNIQVRVTLVYIVPANFLIYLET